MVEASFLIEDCLLPRGIEFFATQPVLHVHKNVLERSVLIDDHLFAHNGRFVSGTAESVRIHSEARHIRGFSLESHFARHISGEGSDGDNQKKHSHNSK